MSNAMLTTEYTIDNEGESYKVKYDPEQDCIVLAQITNIETEWVIDMNTARLLQLAMAKAVGDK